MLNKASLVRELPITSNDINEAKRAIGHTCDGPVTDFVIIARATELVAQRAFTHETAANAIYELLQHKLERQ